MLVGDVKVGWETAARRLGKGARMPRARDDIHAELVDTERLLTSLSGDKSPTADALRSQLEQRVVQLRDELTDAGDPSEHYGSASPDV